MVLSEYHFQSYLSMRTEKQNRRWLFTKLHNFLWKIVQANVYGVLRGQKTIVRDLRLIIDEFEKNI